MGEYNTILSAYTLYRHLEQYCTHPSICFQVYILLIVTIFNPLTDDKFLDWSKLKQIADDISKCI